MSALTDRARVVAEFSEDYNILHELANRVDHLEQDQARDLNMAAAAGWDAALKAMRYEDGTPVQVAVNDNPYREA